MLSENSSGNRDSPESPADASNDNKHRTNGCEIFGRVFLPLNSRDGCVDDHAMREQ